MKRWLDELEFNRYVITKLTAFNHKQKIGVIGALINGSGPF